MLCLEGFLNLPVLLLFENINYKLPPFYHCFVFFSIPALSVILMCMSCFVIEKKKLWTIKSNFWNGFTLTEVSKYYYELIFVFTAVTML